MFPCCSHCLTLVTSPNECSNAFLHGDLLEEVYMQLHLSFHRQRETPIVCQLNKSLYGLKQASHSWFKKFSTIIQQNDFH